MALAPALEASKSAISEDSDSDTTSDAGAVASRYSNVESIGPQSRTTGEVSTFSWNGSTMGTALTSEPIYKRPNFDGMSGDSPLDFTPPTKTKFEF